MKLINTHVYHAYYTKEDLLGTVIRFGGDIFRLIEEFRYIYANGLAVKEEDLTENLINMMNSEDEATRLLACAAVKEMIKDYPKYKELKYRNDEEKERRS